VHVLAIDGSPRGHGHTAVVLSEVLRTTEGLGASTELTSLVDVEAEQVIDQIGRADGIVMGSPVYRASFAFPLKNVLDRLPRGMAEWGETEAPLQGKPVVTVATSASLHHFLALNDLRNVLANFFASHVVPPGLHVPHEGFIVDDRLAEEFVDSAARQGRALVEMIVALKESPTLRGLMPQA